MSDGSKCDIGRLQLMFGSDVTVAAQVGLPPSALECFTLSLDACGGLALMWPRRWVPAHVYMRVDAGV